jgi:hypothetical protein
MRGTVHGNVIALKASADDSRKSFNHDSGWGCGMHIVRDGFTVSLWRPAGSGWWWSLSEEDVAGPVERSGHALPTRREARDAAWRALRRLLAGAKAKGAKA